MDRVLPAPALLTSTISQLRRSAGNTDAVDPTAVQAALSAEHQAHAEAWKQRLHGSGSDAGAWEKKAFGQIHDRCLRLHDALQGLRLLRGLGDAELQPACRKYALEHLDNGRIDHLTDKREVFEILNAVAQRFAVTLTDSTYFSVIVRSAGLATHWPAQWTELQRLLRQPLATPHRPPASDSGEAPP